MGAVVALWLRTPSAKIRRINRITYSGNVLEPSIDVGSNSASATDGSRLYFSQTESGKIGLAQALVANGELAAIRLPSEIVSPVISSLSPDHSNLLVHDDFAGDAEQTFWIVPTLGGNAKRIPDIQAHDATWMPDGKHILYAQGDELFSTDPGGSDTRKIADLPGWAFWLRWSPDGKKLRFSLRDPIHQTASLWEMQAGRTYPLLPGWSHPESECCGSWTGDGKYFVFQSRHGGRSDLWMRREPSAGDPEQITNGPLDFEAPVTGTEGHRVYFIGANPEIGLLQFRKDSRTFGRLEGAFSSAALATFSRDGQWVAWLNTMDGSLWRSRADGSDRFQLTTPPLRVFMMRWSPDDKKLAIMAEEPGQPWRIYILDASGGQLDLLLNENLSEADPDWSSDGKWLVMGRLPRNMSPEKEPRALYEIDVATRKTTEVPGSTGLFSPRLSPDRRFIAALSLTQRSLMLFDRQAGTWRLLTTHSAADPQWSRDSKAVYFQDNLDSGRPIYRVDVRTGSLQIVARLDDLRPLSARDYRLIALAPGDLPVVSAWTSNVNLYSIDLDE
jgi:Tol biopolymer transport system component